MTQKTISFIKMPYGHGCAFTGHRPPRFSFGYNENDERCKKLKTLLEEQIRMFIENDVNTFYSGMALGIDQFCAEIVLKLRKEIVDKKIKLVACIPCEGYSDKWIDSAKKRYEKILSEADEKIVLAEKFTIQCLFDRNCYMIDKAEYLLAVFDGIDKGGTIHAVNYAKKNNKQITIIHPDTLEVKTVEQKKQEIEITQRTLF